MVEGESLVMCETGCHNLLHEHCMSVWADDRKAQEQPVLCPLCRAPWPLKHHPRLTPPLGFSSLTRISSRATTSTTSARSPPLAPDYAFPIMSASFSGNPDKFYSDFHHNGLPRLKKFSNKVYCFTVTYILH